MHPLPSLRCPLCHNALRHSGNSLRCAEGHTYDVARKGYVNFASVGSDALYDKALWQARRACFEVGFFAPLVDELRQHIPSTATVLDAGCGEGSLLAALVPHGGVGVDLARDAVAMAAGAYKQHHWYVADLAHTPLVDNSVDIVLNCLSPAAYSEFERLLVPGGLLIKIVPGDSHLQELRALWGQPSKPSDAAALLRRRYPQARQIDVRYTIAPGAHAASLAGMTPLGAHQTAVTDAALSEMTFAFNIFIANIA